MELWISRFLLHLRSQRNFSPHTLRAYKSDLAEFLRFCRGSPASSDFLQRRTSPRLVSGTGSPPPEAEGRKTLAVEKIDKLLVRTYLARLQDASLQQRKFSRSSVLRKISSLRSFISYLLDENVVKSDPFRLLSMPRKEKRLPRFLSEGEIERLLNFSAASHGCESLKSVAAGRACFARPAHAGRGLRAKKQGLMERDLALLELMYSSGLRRSEASSMNVGDVDFISGFVRVFGKGSRERLVPVGDRALEALRNYFTKRPQPVRAGQPLFVNFKNKRLSDSGVALVIARCARMARFARPVTPHSIRHSFATHLLDHDCNLKAVQEMLGHKNLATTEIYTHVSLERLREVYDRTHPRSSPL